MIVNIRRADEDDAPIIARHRAEMFRDMRSLPTSVLEEIRLATVDQLMPLMATGQYLAWLAADAHHPAHIVGSGGVRVTSSLPRPSADGTSAVVGPQAIIQGVYIVPEWRRRGVARALMETMLRWIDEAGIVSPTLHASKDGRALYEQLGFTPTNEMRRD